MLTQEKVLKTMANLPKEFNLDDLVDRLIFVEKVEKDLAQSDNAEVFSTDQAKEMLRQWKSK